ncbi:hypothetical protein TNCV_415861 [Trichonephila clavipes]|nr:hypothetical protein TNCV_415861 [Trichonephila clavipes]
MSCYQGFTTKGDQRNTCVVAANSTCLTVSDRGLRNSSRKRSECTPVASCISEHYAGDKTFWLGSTRILRKNTLVVVKDLPPLCPFHQPHDRTCGSTAI